MTTSLEERIALLPFRPSHYQVRLRGVGRNEALWRVSCERERWQGYFSIIEALTGRRAPLTDYIAAALRLGPLYARLALWYGLGAIRDEPS